VSRKLRFFAPAESQSGEAEPEKHESAGLWDDLKGKIANKVSTGRPDQCGHSRIWIDRKERCDAGATVAIPGKEHAIGGSYAERTVKLGGGYSR
jgi:hypothetical protein